MPTATQLVMLGGVVAAVILTALFTESRMVVDTVDPGEMQTGRAETSYQLPLLTDVAHEREGATQTTKENIAGQPAATARESETVEMEEVTPATPKQAEATAEEILSQEACDAARASSPFYGDPRAQVIRIEKSKRQTGDDETADLLRSISCYPHPTWLVGGSEERVFAEAKKVSLDAEAADKIPVFVLYNLPSHTTSEWGTGVSDHRAWVRAVADGISTRRAWVILEPDALGLSFRYNPDVQSVRLQELQTAVETLKTYAPNSRVYIDAGHNAWLSTKNIADLLGEAGIEAADGFSLNVSNYQWLSDERAYGEGIAARVGGKSFVIDTGRNGRGPAANREWCNARDRALGVHPTLETGSPHIDAYLWVKPPGESDNPCNGGPAAGVFWLEYALELIENTLSSS